MKTERYFSPELIDLLLSLWRSGNYTQTEFCDKYGLESNQLNRWQAKPSSSEVRFLPLAPLSMKLFFRSEA